MKFLSQLVGFGGRATFSELQSALCVDAANVERAVKCMDGCPGGIRLMGGEVICEQYIQTLQVSGLPEFIHSEGNTSIGAIASRFALSREVAEQAVQRGVADGTIEAYLKVNGLRYADNAALFMFYTSTAKCYCNESVQRTHNLSHQRPLQGFY